MRYAKIDEEGNVILSKKKRNKKDKMTEKEFIEKLKEVGT